MEYRCLNSECNWQEREKSCGRQLIPDWLVIKFVNPEGRMIVKCPYCRGKLEVAMLMIDEQLSEYSEKIVKEEGKNDNSGK